MQIDLTPSEIATLTGVLMAQCHPLLMALRVQADDGDINIILVNIIRKMEHALMAESN